MLPVSVVERLDPPTIDRKKSKKIKEEGAWMMMLSLSLIAVDGAAVIMVNSRQVTGSTFTLTYSGIWGGAIIVCSALLSSLAAIQIIVTMTLQGIAASSCISQSCSNVIANLHIAGTVLAAVLFIFTFSVCGTGCKLFAETEQRDHSQSVEPVSQPQPVAPPITTPPVYESAVTYGSTPEGMPTPRYLPPL